MHDGDGRALPLRVQAAWWSMLTYVLQVRRDPQARAAATTAVAMWRDLDDPAELQSALADLVRTLAEPGDALDRACDALQASAAKGFASPRAELRVHGALAEAARVRRDHATLLACRERELALAREIGWRDMAQAAETNICAALIELHRHAEAAARARALVERIDHDPAGPNANLAWALYMLGEALLPLRAFDEARALVPRLLDAERRFGTGIAWRWILMLVDAQGHVHAAARLLGHVGEARHARKDATDPDEDKLLDRIAATVRTRLGSERAEALIAEGRSLDAAAAAAIAARATDEA
jgi:tetratricopeptide (TPR) repeat protein